MAGPVISSSSIIVGENNGYAEFVVRLSAPSTQTVSVVYYTFSGSAGYSDFNGVNSTTLSFAPGETTKTVRIGLTDDTVAEGNESFYLNLSVRRMPPSVPGLRQRPLSITMERPVHR